MYSRLNAMPRNLSPLSNVPTSSIVAILRKQRLRSSIPVSHSLPLALIRSPAGTVSEAMHGDILATERSTATELNAQQKTHLHQVIPPHRLLIIHTLRTHAIPIEPMPQPTPPLHQRLPQRKLVVVHAQLLALANVSRGRQLDRRVVPPVRQPLDVRVARVVEHAEERGDAGVDHAVPAVVARARVEGEEHPGVVVRVGEDVDAPLLEAVVGDGDVVVEGEEARAAAAVGGG
ncbi:hypothetical protein EJ03DRAFT_2386 [Teratosphaeria nubilosa]|uniref:Uncharacterized protein n=1 Tax=Teratosphaeria nubilosa TaxID=161662 RepID=A0A6G1LN32_9PEZI|nr:hypothetical protein EJ03DRAFT_2386 [Teratosphaeria nubilosa]